MAETESRLKGAQRAGEFAPAERRSDAGELATGSLRLRDSLPFLLRDTHRQFVRTLQDALSSHGIATGQWYVLRVLWEEEGLTQAELSARVGIMTPTTVSTLNALARRGLIVRRAHPDDRRKHRVFLTRKGRQLEKELIPLARRAHSAALKGISPRELSDVRRVLDAIKSNILQEAEKCG